ncbi:DUF2357 domain-containing protein [Priestia megaterium]|uniref:DUF2357 domain-containing protein n=1 Tax=Priestia megaterium TaxID=1404 RepID=UPI00177D3B81|nr:DUF2357 domain-containing protein [Priestia megaterium]MBD8115017.1 hypothetical protein [Priestia megaterium]
MDMHPKVTFIFKKGMYAQEKEAKIDTSGITDSEVIIDEYHEFKVRFECKDPLSVLEIEHYEGIDLLIVKPGDEINLMKGGNTEDMFVPGHYPFKVTTRTNIYEGFYTIKSKHFSNDSLLNLRIYLEKMLRGLSYDLMRQRSGTFTNTMNLSPSIVQVYNHIADEYRKIKLNLDLISKDPITDITKKYMERLGSKRPDSKSLRWLSQKGISKNTNQLLPTIFNEKHTVLTVNTLENQWILFIVNYILRSLRQLEASFTSNILNLEEKIIQKKEDIKKIKQEMASMRTYGYTKISKQYESNINRSRAKIETLLKEIEKSRLIKQEIRYMISTFSKFEDLRWMKEVSNQFPQKQTIRMLKDTRYAIVLRFYKELKKMKKKQASTKEKGIPFKRTWLLFEYYSLGLVIQSLQELGYVWIEGWLADRESPLLHLGTLASDTVLKFEKDDHYIEVAYDLEIETPNNDTTYSRYVDSNGKRPDIRITVLNKNNEIYNEQSAIVIDSKCRSHHYLFHENPNIFTDVMEQLNGYRRLEYYSSSLNRLIFPVSEVLCLYPKQSGAKPLTKRLMGENGIFIQVEPTDPSLDIKPFGYDLLHERLKLFTSRVVEQGKVGTR